MNDLIKDLATKAIVENISSDRWVFNDAELEKFAQSIVQECLSVISDENTKLKNEWPFELEWRCKDGKHIWFKIADHFGI